MAKRVSVDKTLFTVTLLLVFVGLIIFSLVTGGAAAPFIYTLF